MPIASVASVIITTQSSNGAIGFFDRDAFHLAPKVLTYKTNQKHSNTSMPIASVASVIITTQSSNGAIGFFDRDAFHLAPTTKEYYTVWKHPEESRKHYE
jgi:hypothetical protein